MDVGNRFALAAFIFRSLIAVAIIVICGFSNLAYGESDRGWIRGTFTDQLTATGVENVEVTLVDASGRDVLRTRSSSSGEFLLYAIPSGTYDIIFQKPDLPEYRLYSVRVRAGCESTIHVQMEQTRSNVQSAAISGWQQTAADLWSCQLDLFDQIRIRNLPAARNVWYLLQSQAPSSVTDHIDEGGLQAGAIQLVGVHGGTWTQNSYSWDGFNITNPYEPGKPLTYPFFGMLQEFRIANGSDSAETTAAGADFQFISRHSGATFHGEAQAYDLGEPFQSSNLDDRLRRFGFDTTPHFNRFPEGEGSFGGPVRHQQRWAYFASFGAEHVSRVVPEFAATPITNVYSGLLRADGKLGSEDQVNGLLSGQIVKNSQLGARPGIDPTATLLGNDRFELLQGHWMHRYDARTASDLRFGFSHSSPTDTLHHGITTPSYTKLFTNEESGAAPMESDSALSRVSLSGQTEFLRNAGTNWRHQIHIGGDLEESLATEERRVFGGIQLFLFPGTTPSEVAEFDSPSHAMQRLREFSLFAEDDLRSKFGIVLHLGVNLNSSNTFLPKQTSGVGVFVPVRLFAGNRHVVSWASVSPRATVTIPVWKGSGAPRFTAGYSRYYHLLPASYADFANPNALGGAVFRWNDRNQDGIFQSGEEGTLLRVFGGPYSSVDPNLRRPFTDEWRLGMEQDAGPIRMGVRLIERNSTRFVHTVNTGVPASAYTPVPVVDPGDDGLVGTADDHTVTVYNQDASTLGQDRYLLTNPPGLNATYRGVESNITARFAEQGVASISFTAFKSVGDSNPGNSVLDNDPAIIGTLFDNPNTRINSLGRLFFDRAYVAKVAAYEEVPLQFRLGSVISYFDGLPFGRKLVIPDFNQGPFFVMATPRGEPGGFRTQYNLTFDQRLSRDFDLGSRRLTVILDIFNVLNLNKSLREFDVTGPLFAQRKPLDVENPRGFRLGAKLTF
jgi:hypothetical protein